MIHFPVVHMKLFGILKAASKPQIAAILPEPLHASICKLGRVWEMSSTVAQRGTVTPVLTHTYTHTLHLAAIAFFFASYESHWLLKQDNCVNLLQNCLCLCSWITGAWDFFFYVVSDKLQALSMSLKRLDVPGNILSHQAFPLIGPAGVHRWTHPRCVFTGLCIFIIHIC